MTDPPGAPGAPSLPGPAGTPWSRPDPAAAGDVHPSPSPAYGSAGSSPPPPPTVGGWGGSTDWGLPRVPKPGIVALRPLGFLEILDGAISAIRAHPRAMLGLSAIVVAVSTVIQTAVRFTTLRDVTTLLESTSPESLSQDVVLDGIAPFLGSSLANLVISALAQIVLTGVLTMVVFGAVLGEQLPIGAAWRGVRGRVPALLALSLLTATAISVGLVVASLPAIVLIAVGGPLVLEVLVVIAAVLAGIAMILYIYAVLGVAGPAVVLERRGVLGACRRSHQLVRGSFWRVLGILLFSILIVTVIAVAIAFPFGVVSAVVGGDDPFRLLPLTIDAVGATLGGTITSPFAAAVVVLLFVDLRIRREGLDIELARAAGPTTLPGLG